MATTYKSTKDLRDNDARIALGANDRGRMRTVILKSLTSTYSLRTKPLRGRELRFGAGE